MKNIYGIIVFVMMAACYSSCQSSSAHTANKLEMGFSVDTQLVNRVVRDTALQISYRLPAQWQDMTADGPVTTVISQNAHNPIRLMRFTGDTAAGLMLSLTDIRLVSEDSYKELKRNYRQLLNGDHRWRKIKESDFTKEDLYVHQYVMTNAATANFRLVFFRKMKPLAQLDFQAPVDSAIGNHTKILESIIGSFNSIL